MGVRLIRTMDGIEIKPINPPQLGNQQQKELSKEFLDLIAEKLPQQPWPTGIHKRVAQQLGLPNLLVSRAIQELIKRGVFLPQMDGKIYAPISAGTALGSNAGNQEAGSNIEG